MVDWVFVCLFCFTFVCLLVFISFFFCLVFRCFSGFSGIFLDPFFLFRFFFFIIIVDVFLGEGFCLFEIV